jgi:hypothetical protein
MIGAWSITVNGQTYGPYTTERMRAFVSEGRLSPHSLVAREGTADWHEAHEEPEFTGWFAPAAPVAKPALTASFPTAAQTDSVPSPIRPSPAPRSEPAAETGPFHFVVVIERKSGGTGDVERAIASLGPYYRLQSDIWLLSAEQTVNAVRNRLVQELGKMDSLFVIDASHGKAAWFNFGPEADARIRRVWKKAS